MLQYVAVCCSMLQYVAVWCSVLQRDAACCSVLQCVAVYCSVAVWIWCVYTYTHVDKYMYTRIHAYLCQQQKCIRTCIMNSNILELSVHTHLRIAHILLYYKYALTTCNSTSVYKPIWNTQNFLDEVYTYMYVQICIHICMCASSAHTLAIQIYLQNLCMYMYTLAIQIYLHTYLNTYTYTSANRSESQECVSRMCKRTSVYTCMNHADISGLSVCICI